MGTEIWSLSQAGEPEPELERPSRSSSSRTGEGRVTALVSRLTAWFKAFTRLQCLHGLAFA